MMNEKEFGNYEKDEEKNKNPKAQKRANEIIMAAKQRAEKAASSSSDRREPKGETINTARAKNEPETEK